MNLPPPRVREVLSLLRDLSPEQARSLLGQVVATLDAAEVIALRAWLPPQAVLCLPSCVGAVTVMNEAPMPWEFAEPPPLAPARVGVETGKIIAEVLPPPSRKRLVGAIAAVACVVTLGLGALLLSSSAEEPVVIEAAAPSLVPPPPVRDNAPMSAAKVVQPQVKAKRVSTARGASRKAAIRDQAAEWASPFDRRH